jgi:phage shock protein A
MSILAQIQMFFKVRTSAALDAAEDPRQTLEYAYTKQQEMLRQVKQGLIEVATSRRQIEFQAKKLRERLPQLDDQAQRALTAGREDLARMALQRKQTCLTELAQLDQQAGEIAEEERKLTAAERQFSSQVDSFRTRRDSLSARYTAAEAQVHITESLSGLSKDSETLGSSIERAEGKIGRMQARASAIDALMENGALNPIAGGDAIERELNQLSANQAVDQELAALKAKLTPVVERQEVAAETTDAQPE